MKFKTIERHPLEWLNDIRKLPVRVREVVAKIIWWDFFAVREVSKRWKHLDKYIGFNENLPEISSEELYTYLIECGYDHQHACGRLHLDYKTHPVYEKKS